MAGGCDAPRLLGLRARGPGFCLCLCLWSEGAPGAALRLVRLSGWVAGRLPARLPAARRVSLAPEQLQSHSSLLKKTNTKRNTVLTPAHFAPSPCCRGPSGAGLPQNHPAPHLRCAGVFRPRLALGLFWECVLPRAPQLRTTQTHTHTHFSAHTQPFCPPTRRQVHGAPPLHPQGHQFRLLPIRV